VLIARLDEQTDERLTSELAEFRTLAGRGIDPDTGLPLSVSTVDRLFRVALERNVPADDETLFRRCVRGWRAEDDRDRQGKDL
jgi:hypothetical protein